MEEEKISFTVEELKENFSLGFQWQISFLCKSIRKKRLNFIKFMIDNDILYKDQLRAPQFLEHVIHIWERKDNKYYDEEIAEEVIKYFREVINGNFYCFFPLIYAVRYTDNCPLIQLLVKYGADPDKKDGMLFGKSALDYAKKKGNSEMIGILAGASFDRKN